MYSPRISIAQADRSAPWLISGHISNCSVLNFDSKECSPVKRYFQTILLVAIILLSTTLAEDVYALSASGSGNITFDGTGTIIHMQSPFTIIEVFNTNCTPSTVGDIITRCNAPVDTSLLGSGITRAEDVRVSAPFAGPFHV
jgi:hypothetical protein